MKEDWRSSPKARGQDEVDAVAEEAAAEDVAAEEVADEATLIRQIIMQRITTIIVNSRKVT